VTKITTQNFRCQDWKIRIIKNLLVELEKRGIHFSVSLLEGWLDLDVGQVLAFLQDPDLFEAKALGLPNVETLHQLKKFDKEFPPQCTGITKKGRQCKNFVFQHPNRSKDFALGVSDRCYLHKEVKRCHGPE
jgi:hypothetical protein